MGRQAWMQMTQTTTPRYLCTTQGIFAPQGAREPVMIQASQSGQTVQDTSDSVAIPLKVRNQVVGVIRLRKPTNAAEWTPEEVSLMETLTEQLGLAIESARLYQDTQRRATQEKLIGEVTGRMRETLDLETVLQTAVHEMRQALGIAEVEVRLDTDQIK
jgi:GAF domain-containing protein